MNFKNKVIIVTGAGNGIGRELSLQLIAKGANVAAVDINPDLLKETLELSKVDESRISSHILDVRDLEGIVNLKEAVISHHGKVDGLINNAAIAAPFVKFTEYSKQKADILLDINLNAVINLTRTFLPEIQKSEGGLIANVSSTAGFAPLPHQVVYVTSKYAVKGFTEALYNELFDTNTTVCLIMPGVTATNLMKNSGAGDMELTGTSPQKAAEKMITGMENEQLKIFAGDDAKAMYDKLKDSYDEALKEMRNLF